MERLVHLDLKGTPLNARALKAFVAMVQDSDSAQAASLTSLSSSSSQVPLSPGGLGYLIEYEDTLPWYGDLAVLQAPHAYSPRDFAELRALFGHGGATAPTSTTLPPKPSPTPTATAVPLVQTLGHLEFALKHPQFAHLRESEHGFGDACPLKPGTRALVREMLRQTMEAHMPSLHEVRGAAAAGTPLPTPAIHVGLDEVFTLGSCPSCRQRAAALGGLPALFLEHCLWVIDTARTLHAQMWRERFGGEGEGLAAAGAGLTPASSAPYSTMRSSSSFSFATLCEEEDQAPGMGVSVSMSVGMGSGGDGGASAGAGAMPPTPAPAPASGPYPYPGLRVLMWHDMLAHFTPAQLACLAGSGYGGPEVVVWSYGTDVKAQVSTGLWQRLAASGLRVWGGSAWRGASQPDAVWTPAALHIQNHLSWAGILRDSRDSNSRKGSVGGARLGHGQGQQAQVHTVPTPALAHTPYPAFSGMILTGWSRFSGATCLCDPLPAGVPSLLACLAALRVGAEGWGPATVACISGACLGGLPASAWCTTSADEAGGHLYEAHTQWQQAQAQAQAQQQGQGLTKPKAQGMGSPAKRLRGEMRVVVPALANSTGTDGGASAGPAPAPAPSPYPSPLPTPCTVASSVDCEDEEDEEEEVQGLGTAGGASPAMLPPLTPVPSSFTGPWLSSYLSLAALQCARTTLSQAQDKKRLFCPPYVASVHVPYVRSVLGLFESVVARLDALAGPCNGSGNSGSGGALAAGMAPLLQAGTCKEWVATKAGSMRAEARQEADRLRAVLAGVGAAAGGGAPSAGGRPWYQ